MLKKAAFFDFLNRREAQDFKAFQRDSTEDIDYINWNDYLLPQHYGDEKAEYHAIRHSAAIFDVSPIRKFRLTGPAAGSFLDHLFTRPVSSSAVMRGIYVIFCNRNGDLKDDAIVYKLAEDDYLLMPSDIDHSAHFELLRAEIGIDKQEITIAECTDNWVGLALQGPLAATVLEKMGFQVSARLAPFEAAYLPFDGEDILIARMGFTADLGYECWLAPHQQSAFEKCIELARSPGDLALPGYGLRALEACRLEGGFIVAGWDFATEADPAPGFERNPFEVGLGWLVDLDNVEFFGRQALISQKERGNRFLLRTLQIDDPRRPDDGAVLTAQVDGETQTVGSINCSAWSADLGVTVGNASIEPRCAALESASVMIGNDEVEVRLRRGPHLNLDRRNTVPAALFD